MGIDVSIQDQNHEGTEAVSGLHSDALGDLVDRAPDGSLTWGIHPYADTMFNPRQLRLFIAELSALTPGNDREREVVSALSKAAESAIRKHGYLWFSGD